MRAHRRIRVAVWLPLLLVLTACGSSSTTVTSPASAERCAITLNGGAGTVPAGGGSGTVGVTATRECAWSATVEGAWLSIRSGASGQGEGTVEFAASPNPDPQVRAGAIVVNGSRAQISQAAGECIITLATSSADFPQAGGATQIEVRASSSLCAWTAAADAPWITITGPASGRGNGALAIAVAPTTGPPRTATVTISGLQFSVTQSQGCTYQIDRSTHSTTSGGGSGTLAITTAAACPWIATSNVGWLNLTPSGGSGPGAVTFTVEATQGPQRTGTAVVAGQLFTVTQSPGCTYNVQPTAHTVAASGGAGTVSIATSPGCGWAASSNVPWMTIQGATTGNGPGQFTFTVAATTGPARSGTLTVADRSVTVTQTQGCTTTLSATRVDVNDAGGEGSFGLQTGAGCAWTASASASWITITSGATGAGNGTVRFSVAANTGPGRSGSITAGGQTFTVVQGTGCSVTLSADRQDVPAAGGSGSVNVLTGAGCSWAATSNTQEWLTITAGANGSGNGTVTFTATANGGPARQGTLTVGGRTFTVNQAGGCSYTIDPASATIGASGGQLEVDVASGGGCSWTAASQASWIVVTMGATGNNNGRVRLTVEANIGAERSGAVAIAGHTFTVQQAAAPAPPPCVITLTPNSQDVSLAGGTGSIGVAATQGCAWTATASAEWIRLTAPASGTGDGAVQFSVDASATPRSGTITIGTQVFTINQR